MGSLKTLLANLDLIACFILYSHSRRCFSFLIAYLDLSPGTPAPISYVYMYTPILVVRQITNHHNAVLLLDCACSTASLSTPNRSVAASIQRMSASRPPTPTPLGSGPTTPTPPAPPVCVAPQISPPGKSVIDIVLSRRGSSNDEGSHRSVDAAPGPGGDEEALALELVKDPNVKPYGIREWSMASGEARGEGEREREREMVVRCVEGLYVGFGRRA